VLLTVDSPKIEQVEEAMKEGEINDEAGEEVD
jgi:hypothetical protein